MSNVLKRIWNNQKTFFFTVGLIFLVIGFLLTQVKGIGEEVFIEVRPKLGWQLTGIQALGILLIGIGLLSWMAILGSIIVSSEER